MSASIRNCYKTFGVEKFYTSHSYVNPHRRIVQRLVAEKCSHYASVIDLGCGNGEVTEALAEDVYAVGVDPYLYARYEQRTKRKCFPFSFKQLAMGALQIDDKFEVVICSFALHLASKGILPLLLYNLSRLAKELVVISPTKKPEITHWCWNLQEHTVTERVHFRRFKI